MQQARRDNIIVKYQIDFEQDSLFDSLSTDVLFSHFLKFKQAIYFQQFSRRQGAKDISQNFIQAKQFEEFQILRYDAMKVALEQFDKWNLNLDDNDLFKTMILNPDFRVKVLLFDRLSEQGFSIQAIPGSIKLLFHTMDNFNINLDLTMNLDGMFDYIKEKGMALAFQSHLSLTPFILKQFKDEKIKFKTLDGKHFTEHVDKWFKKINHQANTINKLEKIIYCLKEIPIEHIKYGIITQVKHSLTSLSHEAKHELLHSILEQIELDKKINTQEKTSPKRKL
jgi:hypothetical protein